MPEWYDEPLVCTNCEARIDPECEKYLKYEDRFGNSIVLCADCLEDHTHG